MLFFTIFALLFPPARAKFRAPMEASTTKHLYSAAGMALLTAILVTQLLILEKLGEISSNTHQLIPEYDKPTRVIVIPREEHKLYR